MITIRLCINSNILGKFKASEYSISASVSRMIDSSFTVGVTLKSIISEFDKSSSFDRLFPNQDFLSGKGLGNLIALPLHKPALEQGNSCFIDPGTDDLKPYPDQWQFLSDVQKVSENRLDQLHDSLTPSSDSVNSIQKHSGKLQIVLSNAKLRREYDLVGLDLEDDAEDHDHHEDGASSTTAGTTSNTDNEGEGSSEAHHEDSKDGNSSKTETVMGHLASATLAAVLQVVVRTALMGFVSSFISRYTILVRVIWLCGGDHFLYLNLAL